MPNRELYIHHKPSDLISYRLISYVCIKCVSRMHYMSTKWLVSFWCVKDNDDDDGDDNNNDNDNDDDDVDDGCVRIYVCNI